MKKLLSIALVLLSSLILTINTNADPIIFNVTSVTATSAYSLTLAGVNYGGVYTNYTLNTTQYGPLVAFCIENTSAPYGTGNWLYEFKPITDDKIFKAAYLAETYGAGSATQLAIWNLVFDNDYSVESGFGTTYSNTNSLLVTKANEMLLAVSGMNITSDYGWVIANNPVGGTGPYQNYLVKNPVPEPISMVLFGTGLLCFSGYIRRRMKK